MTLDESSIIGRGEIASIFALSDRDVVKLYRADGQNADGLRRLADEECRAYSVALADPFLRRHIPQCEAPVTVQTVVAPDGADRSTRYLLTHGLKMERLSGTDVKLSSISPLPPHLCELRDRFTAAGLYALDAFLFVPDSADECRFIDFTTVAGNAVFCDMIAAGPRASQAEIAAWLFRE